MTYERTHFGHFKLEQDITCRIDFTTLVSVHYRSLVMLVIALFLVGDALRWWKSSTVCQICPEMHQMKCKSIHIRVVRCPFPFLLAN